MTSKDSTNNASTPGADSATAVDPSSNGLCESGTSNIVECEVSAKEVDDSTDKEKTQTTERSNNSVSSAIYTTENHPRQDAVVSSPHHDCSSNNNTDNQQTGLPTELLTSDNSHTTSEVTLTMETLAVDAPLSAPKDDAQDQDNDDNPYGLSGMLKVVRMNDLNLNVLALGTDLTSLGLNLNERETLSSSFASPLLDEQPPKEDIEFYLPPCYYLNPPALKMTHLQKFTAETLFYVFYTVVGGALQGYAAAELYSRGWVYHNSFRKWFTTVTAQKHAGSNDVRHSSTRDNEWIYFEPAVWGRRYHSGDVDTSQFLKPDILRDLLDDSALQSSPSGNASMGEGICGISTPVANNFEVTNDTTPEQQQHQGISSFLHNAHYTGVPNRPPGISCSQGPPGFTNTVVGMPEMGYNQQQQLQHTQAPVGRGPHYPTSAQQQTLMDVNNLLLRAANTTMNHPNATDNNGRWPLPQQQPLRPSSMVDAKKLVDSPPSSHNSRNVIIHQQQQQPHHHQHSGFSSNSTAGGSGVLEEELSFDRSLSTVSTADSMGITVRVTDAHSSSPNSFFSKSSSPGSPPRTVSVMDELQQPQPQQYEINNTQKQQQPPPSVSSGGGDELTAGTLTFLEKASIVTTNATQDINNNPVLMSVTGLSKWQHALFTATAADGNGINGTAVTTAAANAIIPTTPLTSSGNNHNPGSTSSGQQVSVINTGAKSIPASLQKRISKTKICIHNLSGRCSRAGSCSFAHSLNELREPPDLFKTRLCINFTSTGSCPKGSSCRFAHGEPELRSTPEFYKTSLCPYWQTIHNSNTTTSNKGLEGTSLTLFGGCPAGESCRWAHGPDELRQRSTTAAKNAAAALFSLADDELLPSSLTVTSSSAAAAAAAEGRTSTPSVVPAGATTDISMPPGRVCDSIVAVGSPAAAAAEPPNGVAICASLSSSSSSPLYGDNSSSDSLRVSARVESSPPLAPDLVFGELEEEQRYLEEEQEKLVRRLSQLRQQRKLIGDNSHHYRRQHTTPSSTTTSTSTIESNGNRLHQQQTRANSTSGLCCESFRRYDDGESSNFFLEESASSDDVFLPSYCTASIGDRSINSDTIQNGKYDMASTAAATASLVLGHHTSSHHDDMMKTKTTVRGEHNQSNNGGTTSSNHGFLSTTAIKDDDDDEVAAIAAIAHHHRGSFETLPSSSMGQRNNSSNNNNNNNSNNHQNGIISSSINTHESPPQHRHCTTASHLRGVPTTPNISATAATLQNVEQITQWILSVLHD